jgi:hypothetical protein
MHNLIEIFDYPLYKVAIKSGNIGNSKILKLVVFSARALHGPKMHRNNTAGGTVLYKSRSG